ncbi:MAG: hypothetical protein ABIV06_07905, partial [Thermoanaerobaculia bacterium]
MSPNSPRSSQRPRSCPAGRLLRRGICLLLPLLALSSSAGAEHRARLVSEGFLLAGYVSGVSSSDPSPDGRFIVFVACESSDECYLASARRFAAPGEVPQALAGPVHGFSVLGAGIDYEIAGDSRRVVYMASSDSATPDDLWSVAIDGSSAPVRLNSALLTGEEVDDFEITQDGQQVVFELQRPGTDAMMRVAIDGAGGATLLDEGDNFRWELFPAASGNPRLFYFADTDGNDQLEILTVYLSSPPPFPLWAGQLRVGTSLSSVEIAPDGDRIVFTGDLDSEGVAELYSIRADSTNSPQQLSPSLVSGGNVVTFNLSSDGRAVFLADAEVDERFDLWSAPIDDSAAPIKISGTLISGGDVRSARVSGEWAAYIADAQVDNREELWSVPADGHAAPTRRSDTVPSGRD